MRSGGFFAGTTALLSLLVAATLLLRLLLARHPFEGLNPRVGLVAGCLAAFGAWVLISQQWSHAPARALTEYDRALLYALTVVVFGSLGRTVWRIRILLYGVAAATVGLCLVGLVSRTLPDVLRAVSTVHPERLSYPLTYWNAMGLLAAVGLVLCGHLACSERDPRVARMLGAAAVPPLATTLFLTYSRGGVVAAVIGVLLYIVVARPRALVTGALAIAPPTAGALLVAEHAHALATPLPLSGAAVAQGEHVALAVAIATSSAFVLRGMLTALDPWLVRPKLSPRVRRRLWAGTTGGLVLVTVAAALALDLPQHFDDGYRTFVRENEVQTKGASRLTSFSNNGRLYHWRVSLLDFKAHPWNGTGAGTYQTEWARHRPADFTVNDGHSLYLETLGELGLPGLILVAFVVVIVLGGIAVRIRGPDRALYGAVFAAGGAWALHAGVDWDWEMPAVTLPFFAMGGAALARPPGLPALRIPLGAQVAGRALGIAACVGLLLVPLHVHASQVALDRAVGARSRGDCRLAARAALDSLAAINSRPEPLEVLALCDGGLRESKLAERMAAAAVRRDPNAWGLWYELAVLRARAGHDPERAARTAISLNPRGQRVAALEQLLQAQGARAWPRAGRALPLTSGSS